MKNVRTSASGEESRTDIILTQNQCLPDFTREIIQIFIRWKRQRIKQHECSTLLLFLHIAIYNRLISIGDLQESKVNVMFFQKPHVGRHKKPRDQVKFSDGKALGHTTCAPAAGAASLPPSCMIPCLLL